MAKKDQEEIGLSKALEEVKRKIELVGTEK
jgi:hypothetical protein